jgi:hypothetical protein
MEAKLDRVKIFMRDWARLTAIERDSAGGIAVGAS